MSTERTVVSLCKTQASLLVQNLNVTCCAVYVTENCLTGTGERLLPIAIEPEQVVRSSGVARSAPSPTRNAIDVYDATPRRSVSSMSPVAASSPGGYVSAALPAPAQQRDTFPLRLEGEIVGVLALYRTATDWNEEERASIAAVVATVEYAIELHGQNLTLRNTLEATYLNDLQRQSHLSDLFHQVRNPLAALHVFGKLLDRRLAGNSPVLEVVANIIREGGRLKSLLDDLSIVARQPSLELTGLQESIDDLDNLGELGSTLETRVDSVEPVEPAPEPSSALALLPANASIPFKEVSVSELLGPIASVASAVAESRDLSFEAQIECPDVLLRTDVKLMTEALNNLVDNALKYTPDGGRVTIVASQRSWQGSQTVEISICDTGLGIPPEDLDRVFQRGYRGEKRDTDIQGTGLGLQIVKQIVEQLGADIEIDSAGRGQGVKVHLRLPVE